jgi:hypothetical protein
MTSKYTLSDFRNSMSEEDYNFLENFLENPTKNELILLVGVSGGNEGKSRLIQVFCGKNYNFIYSCGYCVRFYAILESEINDKKNELLIQKHTRMIKMWKPRENIDSFMVAY